MKTSPKKIWSRSLLRTALKLGGKCSCRRTVHTQTTPADGREKWSAAPLVHRFLWRKSGLWLEGVNASAVWRKVRAPPPSPAPGSCIV